MKQLIIILSLFTGLSSSYSQRTYVNQEWSSISGLPVNLHWTQSISASTNHIVTVGNTSNATQGPNILITKLATDGSIVWQVEYNSDTNREDYGIAIAEDDLGNFYVAGTSYDTATLLDIVVLKYDVSGNL